MLTTEDLIKKTLEAIVSDFNEQIDSLGFTASGKTARSWNVVVEGNTGKLFGNWAGFNTIVQSRYSDNGKGRAPGKPPPFQAIFEWIQAKGIQGRNKKGQFITHEQFANAIRWGIAKKGTRLYRGEREGVDMKGIVIQRRREMIDELGKSYVSLIKTDGIEKPLKKE
jgi:hypothetical protein